MTRMRSTRYFTSMSQFSRHLRALERSMTAVQRTAWLRNVMGPTIRDLIRVSFLAGRAPEGELWKSPCDETQHNGRWSAKYVTRPSGAAVTADKIRLTDTGELSRSYSVLEYDAAHVTVGPAGDRNVSIATRAEAEPALGGWGNAIAGWSRFRCAVAQREVTRAWEHIVSGVPLSRIRKPTLRAF